MVSKNRFSYFEDISYSNFDTFNGDISRKRKELYNRNYELLNNVNQEINIDSIGKIDDGRFNTMVGGIEFECLFVKKNTDRLYVQFSGSRELSDKLPIFKRWTYSSFMDGSVLSIADPMYRKFSDLKLGWYYGVQDESYCDYILKIIRSVANYLGIKNENIIFYASSGGGYAALYCAGKIKGSTVIAINPQIDLSLYFYSKEFQQITGNDLKCEDSFGRNSIVSTMLQSTNTKYVLVENCRAIEDMTQVEALCKHAKHTMKYGIQMVTDNIVLWIYDAECQPYHGAQEYAALFWAIDDLRNIFDKRIEEYSATYAYINELWHERYLVMDMLNTEKEKTRNAIIELMTTSKPLIEGKYRIALSWTEMVTISGEGKQYTVYDKLEDNTVYAFGIGTGYFQSGMSEKYIVRIRNKKTNIVLFEKIVTSSTAFSTLFKTSKNAKDLVLEICLLLKNCGEEKLIVKNLEVQKMSDFLI